MLSFFYKVFTQIVKQGSNVLLPNMCLLCETFIKNDYDALCINCWKNLQFITNPKCSKCSQPYFNDSIRKISCDSLCRYKNHFYDSVNSCVFYNGIAKKIVKDLKYNNNVRNIEMVARLIYNQHRAIFQQADFIIAVPSHLFKLWRKGYNHSAVIAQRITKISDVLFISGVLLKVINTSKQTGLTRTAREKNLREAFYVPQKFYKLLKNKTIVLIDDVFTTGATANSCALVLKKAGAKNVNVITFAKTVIN